MAMNHVLPIKLNLSNYLGQWVVICGDKLIAHNSDLTKIKKEIAQCKTSPTVAKIPKKETLIF
jgi:hypothetical protein